MGMCRLNDEQRIRKTIHTPVHIYAASYLSSADSVSLTLYPEPLVPLGLPLS